MVATRKITIDTRGPIAQKSGIYGPITVPYLEDVRVISRMIVGRVSVIEHLEDGATKKLTVRDITELTSEATRVLPSNNTVKSEKSELVKLVDSKKAEALAVTKAAVEKAKAEIDTPPEGSLAVIEKPSFSTTAPVVAENVVDPAALSKKERRALEAQQRQEEEIDKK